MRSGKGAKGLSGRVAGGVVVALSCLFLGACDAAPRLIADEAIFAWITPDMTNEPTVVQVPRDGESSWNGELKIVVPGWPVDGWPSIEPVPPDAVRPSLQSIRALADQSTGIGRHSRWAPPFVDPVETTYLYYVCRGENCPTALVIRWKERDAGQAEEAEYRERQSQQYGGQTK